MNQHQTPTHSLYWLALVAALLPLVTIHLTFIIAVIEDYVPWCIPHWDSCTSISRTGRNGTAYFLFKGLMLPAAVAGMLFWYFNGIWLQTLGSTSRRRLWLCWLGAIAGISLGSYTMALGHGGEGFNLIRRTGVVLYFSLTFIAQLLLSAELKTLPGWNITGKRLLWWCELTLGVGIVSVILHGTVYELYSQIDDAFEWVLALLVNLHALWVAILWRRSRFRVMPRTGS